MILNYLSHNWLILSKLYFRSFIRNTFSIEREDLPPILPTPMIFPFELSLNMTFPLLILVMLENNESSLVICLEQALSNNHSSYSFDSYTHKIKMKFLVPIPSWGFFFPVKWWFFFIPKSCYQLCPSSYNMHKLNYQYFYNDDMFGFNHMIVWL